MSEHILLDKQEQGIAEIILNRGEKLNALTTHMLRKLETIVDDIESDPTLRVVILRSATERAFCAGADINEWSNLSPLDMWREWVPLGNRVFDRVKKLRLPTIAAISGIAFGGGLELALACDLRMAVESARFAAPEVKIGTLPGWRGMGRLLELIGPARARQLVLTGEPVTAEEAIQWGLLNWIVKDPDSLLPTVRERALQISGNAPVCVQAAKELLNESQAGGATADAVVGALAAYTQDGREGTAAFLEMRSPRYIGE